MCDFKRQKYTRQISTYDIYVQSKSQCVCIICNISCNIMVIIIRRISNCTDVSCDKNFPLPVFHAAGFSLSVCFVIDPLSRYHGIRREYANGILKRQLDFSMDFIVDDWWTWNTYLSVQPYSVTLTVCYAFAYKSNTTGKASVASSFSTNFPFNLRHCR